MILKEMEKGPNKILLTIDDLVFVSPKSASKNSRVSNRCIFVFSVKTPQTTWTSWSEPLLPALIG